MTSKVKGQGRKVTWCVWQVLADTSRRNVLETPIPSHRQYCAPVSGSKGQRSRSPIGRPTKFNLDTRMEHEDPYHQQAPWPPRLKVKIARSRGPFDRCWPISQEQNVPEIPILVGRLPIRRAIMRTKFDVKRSKVRSPDRLMLKSKACRLRTSNLVGGWCMCYQLPWPAIEACEVVEMLHLEKST